MNGDHFSLLNCAIANDTMKMAPFDVLATFQEAVYVVGDFNIRLERCDDPNTKQFVDLLSHYGFACQPTTATHSAGGTIQGRFYVGAGGAQAPQMLARPPKYFGSSSKNTYS